MIKKFLLAIGISILAAGTLANAGEISENTIVLVEKQKMLSQKISREYTRKNSVELGRIVKELKAGQMRLKKQISDPELSNLLTFMDICISKLQTAIRNPDTARNQETVTDMSASIAEGNSYIKRVLASSARDKGTFVAMAAY